jgi:alpha-galactosidase
MYTMRNASLELVIDPANGVFSIYPLDKRFPRLDKAELGCEYLADRKRKKGLVGAWENAVGIESELHTVEHGWIDLVTFQCTANVDGIACTLNFGIMREYPLVLWKVKLQNRGSRSARVRRIDLLNLKPAGGGEMKLPTAKALTEMGFLSNGWQSWSPTRWYRGDTRMNISRLGFLQHPMIYNPGTPRPRRKGEFSSDMFAVVSDQIARTGLLIGFLAQKQHFGSIHADFNTGSLSMWANGDDAELPCGAEIETDWAVFTPLLLDHRNPLEVYIEAVARENHTCVPDHTPTGWCSWYQYYTGVTAQDVSRNLETILDLQESLPIEVVQIDDGFESSVGDWFTFNPTFPEGVAPLAETISCEGLVPGIWVAPFIVNPRSKLMREHKEWILFKRLGRPVNAGYGWNALTTGLDMTVPGALDFVREVARTTVEDWGFKYLKLDFYYAAGLKGNYHDPTKTRAQVLRMGMEAIREVVGSDVTLLGCGAPLGSMLGIVDMMRIGPDMSGDWAPHFHGIGRLFKQEPSMPSTRNSFHNILTRANLHNAWWINDPDCLLVRPDSNLTLAEVRTLATAIGLTGGALLISDDLTRLPAERRAIAEALIPILNEPVRIPDLFSAECPSRLRLDPITGAGAWHVLAAFNWQDEATDLHLHLVQYGLEEVDFVYREFWSGQTGIWSKGEQLTFPKVPAHGCVVIALRELQGGQPLYAGSDLHITQGVEVDAWNVDTEGIEFTLRLPRTAHGSVYLYLPEKTGAVTVNGAPGELMPVSGSVYCLAVAVEGFCHIHLDYKKE